MKITIKILFFINLTLCLFAAPGLAQTPVKDCYEIKYLDFFGLDKTEKITWSDEEINKLLEKNFSIEFKNTRFLIPAVIWVLKDFHPDCNKEIDTARFNKLVSLYFKLRLKDASLVENETIREKIDFIRDDFYNLAQDEKMLPFMRWTMDDGPLYGEVPKALLKLKILGKIDTDFGKLQITESNNRIILVASDKQNKIIWQRIMKGAIPERNLRNLSFDENPVEKTSLATIVHFHSEGERLNLFLKQDGRFMYYFHSW